MHLCTSTLLVQNLKGIVWEWCTTPSSMCFGLGDLEPCCAVMIAAMPTAAPAAFPGAATTKAPSLPFGGDVLGARGPVRPSIEAAYSADTLKGAEILNSVSAETGAVAGILKLCLAYSMHLMGVTEPFMSFGEGGDSDRCVGTLVITLVRSGGRIVCLIWCRLAVRGMVLRICWWSLLMRLGLSEILQRREGLAQPLSSQNAGGPLATFQGCHFRCMETTGRFCALCS